MHAKKYTVPKVHRAKVDSENTGAGKRSGVHTYRQINKSGVMKTESKGSSKKASADDDDDDDDEVLERWDHTMQMSSCGVLRKGVK